MKKKTTLWISDPSSGGDYTKKVLDRLGVLQRRGAISSLHNDWCLIFEQRACDCDPDIVPWANDAWD